MVASDAGVVSTAVVLSAFGPGTAALAANVSLTRRPIRRGSGRSGVVSPSSGCLPLGGCWRRLPASLSASALIPAPALPDSNRACSSAGGLRRAEPPARACCVHASALRRPRRERALVAAAPVEAPAGVESAGDAKTRAMICSASSRAKPRASKRADRPLVPLRRRLSESRLVLAPATPVLPPCRSPRRRRSRRLRRRRNTSENFLGFRSCSWRASRRFLGRSAPGADSARIIDQIARQFGFTHAQVLNWPGSSAWRR